MGFKVRLQGTPLMMTENHAPLLTRHSQGKNVAVIGAGSSGIQIVPAIQPTVHRLDHYVRGRTWIATPIASDELSKRTYTSSNFQYINSEISALAR